MCVGIGPDLVLVPKVASNTVPFLNIILVSEISRLVQTEKLNLFFSFLHCSHLYMRQTFLLFLLLLPFLAIFQLPNVFSLRMAILLHYGLHNILA